MPYEASQTEHGDTMFHISQMTGSAIWFSGLAENAVLDDGDQEYYFFSALQLLLSSDEPANHIFSYACTEDAFRTYDESAAYLREHGLLKEGTLRVLVESVARMILLVDDSDEHEKLSLIHSLAGEAGFSIPETIGIIDGLRHEYDDVAELRADEFDRMDIIFPNSGGFLQKFRMLYAVEAETELDNMKALEKATEKISSFILGNAGDVFHAIRASEEL